MILGILILAFILWLSISFQAEESKPSCEVGHKWTYKVIAGKEDQHLSCLRCGRKPGDE